MKALRVGLISDTHGLVRPEALEFLAGCDHLLHAGDIGSAEVLARLQSVAPLVAVRGNNDTAPWAASLPEQLAVERGGVRILLLHDRTALRSADLGDAQIVVTGHSHKPRAVDEAGVLYVNPGSAGPRRFSLPVTAGELLIGAGAPRIRIVSLLAGFTTLVEA